MQKITLALPDPLYEKLQKRFEEQGTAVSLQEQIRKDLEAVIDE